MHRQIDVDKREKTIGKRDAHERAPPTCEHCVNIEAKQELNGYDRVPLLQLNDKLLEFRLCLFGQCCREMYLIVKAASLRE